MSDSVLKTKETDTPKDDTNNELVESISQFYEDSSKIVMDEKDSWTNAQEMYLSCFDGDDDDLNLYNPDLLDDIIQRVIEQLQLAPYKTNVPGMLDDEEQVVRDAIRQTKIRSGLVTGLRDNPRGFLSLLLFGSLVAWWGANDDDGIKKGIPIKFQFPKLTQCFFSSPATMIRTPNGEADCNEAMIIFEFSKGEVDSMYPKAKDALPGRLSFVSDWIETQEVDLKDDEFNQITQVAHYYNIDKGIYQIMVGRLDTVVEEYNEEKGGTYPHKVEGKNIIPVSLLRCRPVPGKLHGRGMYHRFGKEARNDARLRNSAYQYMDRNIYPDKFIEIADERYSLFQAQVEEARQARAYGEDFYIQVNPGERPVFSDERTNPLSQEYERAVNDTTSRVKQAGIGLQDVDRPTSEKATATLAEEAAKTRLANQIMTVNAGESVFLAKVIVEYLKLIPHNNKTPINTEVKIKIGDQEVRADTVTYGALSKDLKNYDVYFEEDISKYDNMALELSMINMALPLAQGDPALSRKIVSKILGLLGQPIEEKELNQMNNAQPQPIQSGIQPNQGVPQLQVQ